MAPRGCPSYHPPTQGEHARSFGRKSARDRIDFDRGRPPLPLLLATVRIIALLCLTVASWAASAQATAVRPTYKGFLSSSDPTMTFLFPAQDAVATLVFIPGGEGRRGFGTDVTEKNGYFSAYPFNRMLRSLSDPGATSGRFNVVIFDSPTVLTSANHWSGPRTGTDHLSRVEDVVRHYKERLGKPVWLMGHSLGGISVTETYKRLQDGKRADLVSGLIVSAGSSGTSLNWEATKLPVLVLHHEADQCVGTTVDHAKRIATKLREAGNLSADLVLVNGGSSYGDPCRNGYHMYLDIEPTVAKVLDAFMSRHSAAPTATNPSTQEEKKQ
jgi:dienelactone hydrolase